MTHPPSSWQPDTQPWIRNQPKHRFHICPFCGSHTCTLALDDISGDYGRITLRCINVDCCAGTLTVIAMDSPTASSRHDVQALQAIDEIASSPAQNTTRDIQQAVAQCRQSGTDIPESLTHPTATVTLDTAVNTLSEALNLITSMRGQENALRAELRAAADSTSYIAELAQAIIDASIGQSIVTADLAMTLEGQARMTGEAISELLVGDDGQLSLPRRVTPSQLADVTDALLSLMGALESITADDVAYIAASRIKSLHDRLSRALMSFTVGDFVCDTGYDYTGHDVDTSAWFLREELADFTAESERSHSHLKQAIALYPRRVADEYLVDALPSEIDHTVALLDNLKTVITTSVQENSANSGTVDAMPNSAGALIEIERITHYARETRLLLATLSTS